MLFTEVQRSVRLNKKKKSTNTSPYPDEVIDRLARAFYPAILACWNSEEGQRSLVGARPLHLANAKPFGRLKAPLGLSLLRCTSQTRACLWQAEQAHHIPSKEKQSVPDGERPVVHIAIACGFFRVRPQGRTLFFCYTTDVPSRISHRRNRVNLTQFLSTAARIPRTPLISKSFFFLVLQQKPQNDFQSCGQAGDIHPFLPGMRKTAFNGADGVGGNAQR